MGGSEAQTKCGMFELCIFIGALIGGTACSLTSKVLLDMHSVGLSGQQEPFSSPLFQTCGMFVGMLAALVMHAIVKAFKIPFPGYDHDKDEKLPLWMYFLLGIPALFDLVGTALCMFGLRHVNVSIYQMLRGSAIVFVALLKQFVIGHPLSKFMWVGVIWNTVSIFLVGYSAMLSGSSSGAEGSENTLTNQDPVLGIAFILCGSFVVSLQYAFEEKVMSMDVAAPPLFLIGMEGFWGFLFCAGVLYPIAYALPGNDHGSIENPFNTYEMFKNNTEIQFVFLIYFISIFCYNILAVLVTCLLNSVWHAILDNFRPITVWGSDLVIFYLITQARGESWNEYSYLQLLGMFVLLYGTAVYNAPNPGSIKLTGGMFSCGLDFTSEYAELEDEMEDNRLDEEATKLLHSDHPVKQSPYKIPSSPFQFTPGSTHKKRSVPPISSNSYASSNQNKGIVMTDRNNYGSIA